MHLSDLFVSHKQVDPVKFDRDEPALPQPIYLNLDRAKKVTSDESSRTEDTNVDSTSEQNTIDAQEVNYEPGWSVKNDSLKTSKAGETSDTTKGNSDYKYFQTQLYTFIKNNPKYKGIMDSLNYLAQLESSYKMDVSNKAGSGALGWFQFMDGTRKSYNTQTRQQFASDPQAQLLAAAQHYTKLQQEVAKRGGDPNDFVTMYGAWWRPESAFKYITDKNYDYTTKYNESFSDIIEKARTILRKYGKSYS